MSKRITDLADILHNASLGEVEHLDALSLSLNGSRAAAGAPLIADRVYETLGQSALKDEPAQSSVNRWLAGATWSQLNWESEPTEAFLGTAIIHLTQLFLLPGTHFKRGELRRQVSDALRRTG